MNSIMAASGRGGEHVYELEREEIVAAVDRQVEDLIRQAGLAGPPVDAIALARGPLGMTVSLDRRQPQRGRAQRVGNARQIYVRDEPTVERHQWTVAHEIGEHLRPRVLEALGVEGTPTLGESLANLFAYRLLAPTCWFASDAPELAHDVVRLKKRYATASHEVVAWRLLDLPEPCVITIFDNNHLTRRRSNAWPVTRQAHPVEMQCQRYVNEYSRARRTQGEGWSVQGWPVHQADWKREILRSTYEEP